MSLYRLLRPLLFAVPPDVAHAAAMVALGAVEHVAPLRAAVRSWSDGARDGRLAVEAMGLRFPSPLGLAAGFDKNARRPRALAALGFGHLELGTVTARAQDANPRPNLFRLPADRALVNRLGFPNEGAARVAERIAAVRPSLDVPIGISIGKSRAVDAGAIAAVVADYVAAFECVQPVADFVVVNVSSPNTVGLRTLQAGEHARALLTALCERARAPARLLVKIAPDIDDEQLEALARLALELRLAGLVVANTTLSRAGLQTERPRVEAIGAGGLSGAPLKRRTTALVARVRTLLGPGPVVIGVGGVEDASDVRALLEAGANLVQAYTGFVYGGPGMAVRIARDLSGAGLFGQRAERFLT